MRERILLNATPPYISSLSASHTPLHPLIFALASFSSCKTISVNFQIFILHYMYFHSPRLLEKHTQSSTKRGDERAWMREMVLRSLSPMLFSATSCWKLKWIWEFFLPPQCVYEVVCRLCRKKEFQLNLRPNEISISVRLLK